MTSRAEKGAGELPTDERNLVAGILAVPFLRTQTTKMTSRKDIDLWRVDANRDVRITYRVDAAGAPLIIHIGRHADSDSFVNKYKIRQEQSYPIAQSSLLKDHKPATPPAPAAATEVPEPVLAAPVPQPQAPSLTEKLGTALSEVVHQFVKIETSHTAELALQEADRLGQRFTRQSAEHERLRQEQSQQQTALNAVREEVARAGERIGGLDAAQQTAREQVTELHRGQHELSKQIETLAVWQQEHAEQFEAISAQLGILAGQQQRQGNALRMLMAGTGRDFEQLQGAAEEMLERMHMLEAENRLARREIAALHEAEEQRRQRGLGPWLRRVGKKMAAALWI